jgi:iron complex outermembrane receptor protein
MLLPSGAPNPYYPGNGNFTPNIPLNPAYAPTASDLVAAPGVQPGFVHVKFRDLPNGPRQDNPQDFQQRLVASLEGTVAGWDYQAAATYNSNQIDDYIAGYSNGPLITTAVLNGVVNPFGPQSAAGAALLAGAGEAGLLQTAKGVVQGVDAHASRDLGDWFGAGRPAALALGAEASHQNYNQHANAPFATLVVSSTGVDPNTLNAGTRNVYAGYAELNVPVMKMLDVTGSVRYDKYSDFGNTTNPKVSFRFQPVQQALIRGSYSTGFRAPNLYELHSAQFYTNTPTVSDPLYCADGHDPTGGHSAATVCNVQFQTLGGGNLQLKPEKSKNATLGILIEPTRDMNFGVDYWWIDVSQTIGSIPATTIIQQFQTFAGLYHRLPDGTLSTDGSACPNPATCGYIDDRTQNLGKTLTSGLDISANYRLRAGTAGNFAFGLNSTYVLKYVYQDYTDGPYNQNVGAFVGAGPIFRWQHNANVTWTNGAWGAGVAGHYKSGYSDEYPGNNVASYTTFDIYGSWAMTKALSLTLGIRNAFDREPPFSNQDYVFQAGYDPRFTDPTGRTYYARGTYSY